MNCSPKLAAAVSARAGSLLSVAFSPDGSRLFAGSLVGNVALWDLTAGRELASAKVHQGSVFSVGFTADGQFVSAGPDAIRFWRTADAALRP